MRTKGVTRSKIVAVVVAFLMPALGYSKEPAPAGGRIQGRVTIGGKPAPGVVVSLERRPLVSPSNYFTAMYQPANVIRKTTDLDGVFRFGELLAGKYSLLAEVPAYVVAGAARKDWWPSKRIELTEGEAIENADFGLARGGVITGRVTDEKGRSLPNQLIRLKPTDDYEKWPDEDLISTMTVFTGSLLTDDRGIYRIYGLPAGHYQVSAVPVGPNPYGILPGFSFGAPQQEPVYYSIAADSGTPSVVAVTEGSEIRDVDIRYGRPPSGYKASGRIVDAATGKAIGGAVVNFGTIRPDGGKEFTHTEPGALVQANEKGDFLFTALRPGKYLAFAVLSEDSEYYSEYAPFEISGADLSGLTVRVRRGQTVSGVVIIEGPAGPSEPDVLARALFMVTSQGIDSNATAWRNSLIHVATDGSFRLVGVQPGQVRFELYPFAEPRRYRLLRIERSGAEQKSGVRVSEGENISDLRAVVAVASGVLRGVVKVTEGTLKGNDVWVEIRALGASGGNRREVEPDGQFVFDALSPGEYDVIVYAGEKDRTTLGSEHVRITIDTESTVNLAVTIPNKKKDQ